MLRQSGFATLPRAAPLPQLPDDVLYVIWSARWRGCGYESAAVHIQSVVRGVIARARGDPWDLPELRSVSEASSSSEDEVEVEIEEID